MTAALLTAVRVTSPVPRDLWHAALAEDPDALATQTPGWLDAMCAVRPYRDVSRLYEWEDGRRLVLPLVRSRLTTAARAQELGWPLDWGIGGPVAPGGPVTREEAATVFADLARRPGAAAYLRPSPLTDEVWRAAAPDHVRRYPRITQIADLSGGYATVWSERFTSNTRRNVRKAERAGISVEVGNDPRFIREFDRLYRMSVDRWAAQEGTSRPRARWRMWRKDPRRKFAAVARHLGDACQIWLAHHQGRPVAGIITMRQGEHAKYWRGAMDKALAAATGAPTLLQALAIEAACAQGCRYYHMGDSRPDTPVTRFKHRMGGRLHHTEGWWIDPRPDAAPTKPGRHKEAAA